MNYDKGSTHIVIFLLIFVILRVVVVVFLVFVLIVIYRRLWRMVMNRKTAVDAMPIGSRVLILIDFACHASFGKLFHHLDELFAIVFQQVVRYCEYAT